MDTRLLPKRILLSGVEPCAAVAANVILSVFPWLDVRDSVDVSLGRTPEDGSDIRIHPVPFVTIKVFARPSGKGRFQFIHPEMLFVEETFDTRDMASVIGAASVIVQFFRKSLRGRAPLFRTVRMIRTIQVAAPDPDGIRLAIPGPAGEPLSFERETCHTVSPSWRTVSATPPTVGRGRFLWNWVPAPDSEGIRAIFQNATEPTLDDTDDSGRGHPESAADFIALALAKQSVP